MTAKRDLKRRARDRQARTGESYVTALRQVLAQKPAGHAVEVVEMLDVTDVGRPLGVACRAVVTPTLARRVAPARLLGELVKVLDATAGDPLLELLRAVIRAGERRVADNSRELVDALAFVRRAQAGIGGLSAGGRWLALRVDDVMVLYRLQLTSELVAAAREPLLVVGALDELELIMLPEKEEEP